MESICTARSLACILASLRVCIFAVLVSSLSEVDVFLKLRRKAARAAFAQSSMSFPNDPRNAKTNCGILSIHQFEAPVCWLRELDSRAKQLALSARLSTTTASTLLLNPSEIPNLGPVPFCP